jgi:DNA-binding NtrC family response regulator
MAKVLVIEKGGEIRRLIESRFGSDLSADFVPSIEPAKEMIRQTNYDVIVWNACDEAGGTPRVVRALRKIAQKYPATNVFILSDSEEPQIASVEDRLCHWIERPFDDVDLCALIRSVLESKSALQDAAFSDPQILVPTEFEGIVVASLPVRTVLQRIVEAAAVDVPVLVSGETGTGKDLVASAIHKRSLRKECPYLAINMGAIPSDLVASELFGHERGAYTGASESRSGIFEQARGGTIYLDEITTMDEKTQVSLLRVLETKTIRRVRGDRDIGIDARIIAATNENIEEAVKQKNFREDLYYRLDVFRIHLPPLRERPGDVSFLTNHFISRFDATYKKSTRVVPPEVYRLLRSYPWPGNVRELKNVIQRAVIMAKGAELTPDLLPGRIREAGQTVQDATPSPPPIHVGMSLDDAEKQLITLTLSSVGGNKLKAATILGISRRSLYDKLKKYRLL